MARDASDRDNPHAELITEEPFSAVEVVEPDHWSSPFIFASPHSGRRYPTDIFEKSRLPLATMRRSEDAYVDLLVDMTPSLGAPLLKALFPRLILDVNRAATELDSLMFSGDLPIEAASRSSRVLAGFGVLPRLGADGLEIYRQKLPAKEATRRLHHYYRPYHKALRSLLHAAQAKFGCAILIDCHSMPSSGMMVKGPGGKDVDIVLGDRFGHSCSAGLISLAERLFNDSGYVVTRNAPYAGGFVAQHYGKPSAGVHVLQIEIARRLYMDEHKIIRHKGFDHLRGNLKSIFNTMMEISPTAMLPAQAAE